jgi:hypothetical protein
MTAMTNAARQKRYRQRRNEELIRLRKLEAKLNGVKPVTDKRGLAKNPRASVTLWAKAAVDDARRA